MGRWATRLVLPLVLLAATAVAAYLGFRADDDAARQRANSASVRSVAAVQALTDALSQRVEDVSGLFEASDEVSSEEFSIFSRSVVRSSQASAIAWAQVVKGNDRTRFERQHHLKITTVTPTGKRVAASKRGRYVVATYAVQRDNRRATLGRDLDSSPERHRALVVAAGPGNPVATPPIDFGDGKLGISLYMPVYGFKRGASFDGPIGYAIGAFRFDDLAATLTNRLAGTPGLDLSFKGKSLVSIGERNPNGDIASSKIDIAGQTWIV